MHKISDSKQKKQIQGLTRLSGLLFCAFSVLFLMEPLAAQSEFQSDWSPNTYKVKCQAGDRCLAADDQAKVEKLLPWGVDSLGGMNFKAPTEWGAKLNSPSGYAYIEIYDNGDDGIAATQRSCAHPNKLHASIIVGRKVGDFANREYLLYYFLTHEVFHLIQHTYRFINPDNCAPHVPGWIVEGTATAVAQQSMSQRYPSSMPSNRDDQEARGFAGLRRYDIPLPDRKSVEGQEIWTADHDSYRTSSFWWHLAHTYYNDKFTFLDTYLDREAFNSNWVAWLRNNLELGTGTPLGIVHAGFLADYAGWGDKGYPGEFFGRRTWLDESFGGCQKLFLDKSQAQDYVEIELRPLSGECIEVRVSALGENGIKANESAAVQIAGVVIDGPVNARNGLHLGLAFSNDRQNFHCAKLVKAKRKQGLGRCIFVPDDGKVRLNGSAVDARVWNVIAQEKNPAAEVQQQPGSERGELVNVYTASYSPITVSSKDTRYGGIDPITVRLYFVLDVASITTDSQASATTKPRKRVTADLDATPSADPQTTLPKQNAAGQRVNSFALPANLRPNLGVSAFPLNSQMVGKLSVISVSEDLWTQDGTAADRDSLQIYPLQAEGDNFIPTTLDVGASGTYPVSIKASLQGELAGSINPGSLEIIEFTDLVLRANFSGTVCRVKDLRESARCANPVPVSGSVVKAFAGSRLPGQFMLVEDTPGMTLYRELNENALGFDNQSDTDSGTGEPTDSGQQNPGSAESRQLEPCACTCEEMDARDERAAILKERLNAGDQSVFKQMMGLQRCSTPCQPQYLACVMQRSDAARKAELEAREQVGNDCDCSCPAYKKLIDDTRAMQQNPTPWQTSPKDMDAISRMSTCMNACQKEFQSCLMNP